MAIRFSDLCARVGIAPRGVIQAGAHTGEELDEYLALGARRMLFIEANPRVFPKLLERTRGVAGAAAVCCAVGEQDGSTTLHVTSMDQSSSILPLKLHREIYPKIHETETINVPCRRLDTLLPELKLDPRDFNLLSLDIQGAELMALRGATRQLVEIDALRTEVNLAELYEGCALIGEMDTFLGSRGFARTSLECAWHPTWGDALYFGRPVVSMGRLGQKGRFANQLFQYMFLKIYQRMHGLEVQLPPWIGNYLYGTDDPPITTELPRAFENKGEFAPALAEALSPHAPPLKRLDLAGYFQSHTRQYAPHRDFIERLFRPVGEAAAAGNLAVERLRDRGRTVFGIHLRRGDYVGRTSDSPFYPAPTQWYLRWLEELWPRAEDPVLYIASDEPATVVGDFASYHPVVAADLGVDLPRAAYFIDYYMLCHADLLAISNSSFSFHAAMLNRRAAQFVRPDRLRQALVCFDPWDDLPLWTDR